MRDVAASEGVRASAAPPECRGGVASAASSQAPSSIDHLSLQRGRLGAAPILLCHPDLPVLDDDINKRFTVHTQTYAKCRMPHCSAAVAALASMSLSELEKKATLCLFHVYVMLTPSSFCDAGHGITAG